LSIETILPASAFTALFDGGDFASLAPFMDATNFTCATPGGGVFGFFFPPPARFAITAASTTTTTTPIPVRRSLCWRVFRRENVGCRMDAERVLTALTLRNDLEITPAAAFHALCRPRGVKIASRARGTPLCQR